jgi:flagellar protein FliS
MGVNKMTVSQLHGYSAYREARINEYEQSELILMMYTGAVDFLNKAIASAKNDPDATRSFISKAKNVILELMSSLNLEDGGEVGQLLLNTYTRQFHALHMAQMTGKLEKVSAVRDSLIEIEDAWKDVFNSDDYLDFKRNAKKMSTSMSLKG